MMPSDKASDMCRMCAYTYFPYGYGSGFRSGSRKATLIVSVAVSQIAVPRRCEIATLRPSGLTA